jgi:hypothetical protein
VGKMPKGKAEEHIKQLIEKYKKKNIYDPATGAINSSLNIQSLTEDYWFAKNDEGKGTEVSQFTGGTQLGELNDVNYFLQKLYKTLKLPKSRWEAPEANTYSSGRSGEITREEVKFSRFVERLQRRFKSVIMDPFITLLKMRGIDEQWLDKKYLNIEFTKSNLFKEYKEIELLDQRFGLLGSASSYMMMPGNEGNALFSKEFVLRKYFAITDSDWKENEKLMAKEKKEIEEQGLQGNGQFGNQFGNQFGGQDQFGNEGEEENQFGKNQEQFKTSGSDGLSKEDQILANADKAIGENVDLFVDSKDEKRKKNIKKGKQIAKQLILGNKDQSNINTYKKKDWKDYLKEI